MMHQRKVMYLYLIIYFVVRDEKRTTWQGQARSVRLKIQLSLPESLKQKKIKTEHIFPESDKNFRRI